MGVPAFFRWLSRKYPSIIVSTIEDKNVKSPEDLLNDNPNGVEFDNVYLDMNGIIHPCCHPENKAAPANEDEMMIAIFEYIDRLFNILRPRKLLYMAIDGVAPRAKMNQQRSRRFRAAQESSEKAGSIAKVIKDLLERGIEIPDMDKPHFDSNCITPGTPFMFRLSKSLQFYIQDRMSKHPAWKNLKVILSDANVPGEGEHKIMDYIRKQRANPDHDPNTRHCLCGADADLIMLGLATHEPHFTIIREEFKPNQTKPCDLCGESDHELKDCQGGSSPASSGLEDEADHEPDQAALEGQTTNFLFIRLDVLREYLERDLALPSMSVVWDFERLIDDWVFMCFFVGNDFLPHLPSLEIREGAIDRLIEIYKKTIPKLENYLTENGKVNLKLVQHILRELGQLEDSIFKQRQERELRFKRRDQDNKRRQANVDAINDAYYPLGPRGNQSDHNPGPRNSRANARPGPINFIAAGSSGATPAGLNRNQQPNVTERGRRNGNRFEALTESAPDPDQDPTKEEEDDVRLWEAGFRDRYYATKFKTEPSDVKFRDDVAKAYTRGLCWVLLYYYQGCPAWNWFFPYHYAPFASDFRDIAGLPNDFEAGTEPFKPLEQLMAVFPEASSKHVPPTWANLMRDPKSPIIDFYPENFCVDLNGKRFAWQGVALLPFVDEERLLETLRVMVYPDLTEPEIYRNSRSFDRLYVGCQYPAFEILNTVAQHSNDHDHPSFVALNPSLTGGMAGSIKSDPESILPGNSLASPLDKLNPIAEVKCVGVFYKDPQYPFDFVYPAKLLPNLKLPAKILKPGDWNQDTQGRFRPSLGFRPSNSNDPASRVDQAGQRILRRTLDATLNHNQGSRRPGDQYANQHYQQQPMNQGLGQWGHHHPYANDHAYGGAYNYTMDMGGGAYYAPTNPHPANGGRYQNLPMDYGANRFNNRAPNYGGRARIHHNQAGITPFIVPRPSNLTRPAPPPHLIGGNRGGVSGGQLRSGYSTSVQRAQYAGNGYGGDQNHHQQFTRNPTNFEAANFTWQQQMLEGGGNRGQRSSYQTSSNNAPPGRGRGSGANVRMSNDRGNSDSRNYRR